MTTVDRLRRLKVGYAPYTDDLRRPGDRRRFPHYASSRGLPFEIARRGVVYDLVVISARADIVRWAEAPASTKVVYDLIDSYLALPRLRPKNLLRGTAKFVSGELSKPVGSYHRAIEAMCRRADAVVCSTEEQRQDVLSMCSNAHVILDFHSEVGHVVKTDFRRGETFNLVWEGLPATLGPFRRLRTVLTEFASSRPLALHLVTDLRSYRYLDRIGPQSTQAKVERIFAPAHVYEWNAFMLPHIATACDMAIIPLDLDDPFSAGKPENKLVLFWRMGLPTLATATPAHRRAMRGAGLDMGCVGPEDWRIALERFSENEQERQIASVAGRGYVARYHTENATIQRWDQVLETLW